MVQRAHGWPRPPARGRPAPMYHRPPLLLGPWRRALEGAQAGSAARSSAAALACFPKPHAVLLAHASCWVGRAALAEGPGAAVNTHPRGRAGCRALRRRRAGRCCKQELVKFYGVGPGCERKLHCGPCSGDVAGGGHTPSADTGSCFFFPSVPFALVRRALLAGGELLWVRRVAGGPLLRRGAAGWRRCAPLGLLLTARPAPRGGGRVARGAAPTRHTCLN